MKLKPKGRKIYKTKEKNYYGKSPVAKMLSGALTVLLIGGIGFIGYSLAEPIINYTQHKGDIIEPTEAPTEETTVPAEDETEAAPAPTEPEYIAAEIYKAASLKPSDLASAETLQAALDAIPTTGDIEYVQVPLKTAGGYLCYASDIWEVQEMGAVQYNMPLYDIINQITSNGYKAAAVVSTFRDALLPTVYADAGYLTIYGYQWVDNYDDYTGKPWASPYSDRALEYLSSVFTEVSAVGFDRVICTDLVFPEFKESDYEMLDEQLSRPDRCIALTSAANLFYDKVLSNGSTMAVEVSAADLLKGNGDILQPMLLAATNIILNIDLDELGEGVSDGSTVYEFAGTAAENAEKCLTFISEKLADFNVTIRLSGASKTFAELSETKDKIADYGYTSFVIG